MIKKFVAWVKALFSPAKIEDVKVDEYIAKQSSAPAGVLQSKNVKVTICGKELTGFSEKREVVVEAPKKSLDEQLKEVELPTYARGKKLPPRAKRQYIAQGKRPAPARRLDDTPHSTGGHVTSHGIDPVNAALYGYAAATIVNDHGVVTKAPPVEECRSTAATSTYSSSYSSHRDDSHSYSNHSSSSYGSSSDSSYDSSSYDSGSSSSSCD